MGRPKKLPKNDEDKNALLARHPNWEFVICEVCHDWCVVLPEIVERFDMAFHPHCVDTGKHMAHVYRQRRERAAEQKTHNSMFD